MRLLVLQHIACEHPGVFSDVIRDRRVEATVVQIDEGDPLPDWRQFDAVLVMGGPMGAGDESDCPWLGPEKALIRDAVGGGKPFLGVCLGVQLLAAALGAPVFSADRPEVGLLEVELTDEGRADPLFAGLDDRLVSLQWHGDTFELPPGAVRLARSTAVENQAFRAGDAAYGIQFHLEVTPDMASEWATIPAYRESLASTLGEAGGEDFLEVVKRRAPELHVPARRLFANWLALAGAPA